SSTSATSASTAGSGSRASRPSASSTCGEAIETSPSAACGRGPGCGYGASARRDDRLAGGLGRRRRDLGERRGVAVDGQALLAPLWHAAAEPVDLRKARADRRTRRLVRLPALR